MSAKSHLRLHAKRWCVCIKTQERLKINVFERLWKLPQTDAATFFGFCSAEWFLRFEVFSFLGDNFKTLRRLIDGDFRRLLTLRQTKV